MIQYGIWDVISIAFIVSMLCAGALGIAYLRIRYWIQHRKNKP